MHKNQNAFKGKETIMLPLVKSLQPYTPSKSKAGLCLEPAFKPYIKESRPIDDNIRNILAFLLRIFCGIDFSQE
jgi:hypothetical protein